MKLFSCLLFSILALQAQDQTVLSNQEIISQAREAAVTALKEEITTEKVAAENKITWPAPKAPSIAETEKLVVLAAEKEYTLS